MGILANTKIIIFIIQQCLKINRNLNKKIYGHVYIPLFLSAGTKDSSSFDAMSPCLPTVSSDCCNKHSTKIEHFNAWKTFIGHMYPPSEHKHHLNTC